MGLELSLKELNFPKCWETKPNKTEYMEFVYQEAVDMGVWRKDNKINTPSCAELMVWFFAFDDLFDGGFIDDDEDEQYRLSNRMNKVFLEGTIEDDSTGAEKMDSVIPFNKLKNNQKSLELDLYLYHRKYNIGGIPCAMITEIILDPMSTIESCIWSDPRWIKMCETICQLVTLANDCVSYDKEIKENGGVLNPLKFIQIQMNISIKEAYEYISNYSKKLVIQYIELEKSFVKSYKSTAGFNSNLIPIVDHLRSFSNESISWSVQTPRYLSQTHPFVELRKNTKIITKICDLK
ncbi:hypothetical protein ACTFIR_012557 [Dictyostelium discoideum]